MYILTFSANYFIDITKNGDIMRFVAYVVNKNGGGGDLPRPRKYRKVCRLPDNDGFAPVVQSGEKEAIVLNVDEYEAIRLIDREGFSQEQCGEYMRIARATVQQIYTSARKKLADALVEGRYLRVSGGSYWLCDAKELDCGCDGCKRYRSTQNKHTEGV
jgi:predicted DNA-binding protein (UPF0251 family)